MTHQILKNLILLIFIIALSSCSGTKKRKYKVRKVKFFKTEYSKLVGWKYDNHLINLKTFSNSCQKILQLNNSSPISTLTNIGGSAKNWKLICKKLESAKIKNKYRSQEIF